MSGPEETAGEVARKKESQVLLTVLRLLPALISLILNSLTFALFLLSAHNRTLVEKYPMVTS